MGGGVAWAGCRWGSGGEGVGLGRVAGAQAGGGESGALAAVGVQRVEGRRIMSSLNSK